MANPTRWTLAFVAAAIVCAALWWISALSSDGAAPRAAEAASEVPDERAPALAEPPSFDDPVRRTPLAAADDAFPEPGSPTVAPLRVRGRVLDLDRRPVAGLEIGRFDSTERTGIRSAADGTFELALDDRGSGLEARGPGWATVWADRHDAADSPGVVTILVAPAGRLAGVVVDPDGHPVARADVATDFGGDALRNLSDVLRPDPHEFEYAATSAADGRFDLGEVPLVPGSITAERAGGKSFPVDIPQRARADLELRLKSAVGAGVVVRGRVIDARGAPAEGAFVGLGGVLAKAKADGAFELTVFPAERLIDLPLDLVAVRHGELPARITIGHRADVERAAGRSFELVLGGAPLAIRGRVVDSDGRPVEGVEVSLLQEEHLGQLPDGQGFPGMRFSFGKSVEAVLRGEGEDAILGGHVFVVSQPRTAEDGSFRIEGLQDRAYGIRASKLSGALRREVHQVAAGTHDLRIELDTRAPTQLVRGRVIDGAGRPVANAQVTVTVSLPGERSQHSMPAMRCGSDGAFRFEGVPGTVVQIRAELETHEAVVEPAAGETLEDVLVTLRRLCAIQVEMTANPDLATSFEVVDDEAVRLDLYVSSSTVSRNGGRWGRSAARRRPIRDGRSDIVTVVEGELTAVLYRGELEVARVPIVFAREGLTVVRP